MKEEQTPIAYDPILDSITEGVFTVDREWRITSFNRAAEEITGISRERAIGKPCKDILRANICEGQCALGHTMETGDPIVNRSITIVDDRGRRKPISITTALLKDADGKVIGGVETFRDLTRMEKLRKEIRRQYEVADIISRNHRMQGLFSVLPDIADSPSTVLIEGESGTGKELFAGAIHQLSRRRKKPFVAVNCGALAGHAAGIGAVRLQGRRVHGCEEGQAGTLCARRRGDALPRRDRRRVAGHAGAPAALPSGTRL